MSFFNDAQLAALQIERMVFHLVGPKAQDFVRLEELHPGPPFADFFLELIRSVNGGTGYQFSDVSPTRECLARLDGDLTQFQVESEELAERFHSLHVGQATRGAFLVFVLKTDGERSFALLKYDDETVLGYDLLAGAEGRKRVELEVLERTFVQNPDALQKSALVRLTPARGDLVVMDRLSQPVARYFENFLGAVRTEDDAELTRRLVQITREVIRANPNLVPEDAYSRITQRTFDAAAAGGLVEAEAPENFLETVLGQPLPQGHPLLPKFVSGLKRVRLDGTPIVLDAARVSRPTTLRLVTVNNIQITLPMDVRDLVVVEPHRIIINDDVLRRYDDTGPAR